jgi:3-dehydroquinate synthase II
LKKIILSLNTAIRENIIDDFVNTAIELGISDFIVDNNTIYEKITSVEHATIYSYCKRFNPQFLVLGTPNESEIEEELVESRKSNYLVGIHFMLSSKEDEKEIISLAKNFPDIAFIIVELANTEWKVLPFENLIAELLSVDILLFAKVHTIEDTNLMTRLLEVGVDGILYSPSSVKEIYDVFRIIREIPSFPLHHAELIDKKPISKADRVCVDTTSMLQANEGMLIGSTAKGFALIQAEVSESAFTSSRPFRVNAGDVSAYILVPSFDEKGQLKIKTRYLSELQAGDDVIIVNTAGKIRIVTIGRVKIENRPMILLNFILHHEEQSTPMNVILQNAETVHLIHPDGTFLPVTKLKRGDTILAYLGPGATHFGIPIKEKIIEK